ncbi:MAG: TIGR03905 family TSCPD domain-containing protein [Clostridiales Family XIII bacterium]|jgi:uncharacterized protein (TIGR03905 family)|nr:TIGR03905 family TSCPD domain-containing protein [Clostridiales Family XIII bacterium]
MKYSFEPRGVCSQRIDFQIEDGLVQDVAFYGGCNGNAQGIGRLVAGMPAREVIKRLSGIQCGGKPTSCPDQLAAALRAALERDGEGAAVLHT